MKHGKLRKRIRECGYTQHSLALKVNMLGCTLNRKLCGDQPFKWQEVLAICEVLDIANPIGWFE